MKIDYGKKGLRLSLDPSWNNTVPRPEEQKPITDPVKRIRL